MSKQTASHDVGFVTNETTEWVDLGGIGIDDLDPPSYLPTREQLQPRIPDLCPDESRDEK